MPSRSCCRPEPGRRVGLRSAAAGDRIGTHLSKALPPLVSPRSCLADHGCARWTGPLVGALSRSPQRHGSTVTASDREHRLWRGLKDRTSDGMCGASKIGSQVHASPIGPGQAHTSRGHLISKPDSIESQTGAIRQLKPACSAGVLNLALCSFLNSHTPVSALGTHCRSPNRSE